MHRREMITIMAAAAAVLPRCVHSHQTVQVIGFLCGEVLDASAFRVAAFRQGL